MGTLLIKLGIHLEDYDLDPHDPPHGPLFYRWLPQGDQNAIHLETEDSDMQLKVWFEPMGFVDERGFLRFSYERKDFDRAAISRQAVLDAGPLRGLLQVLTLSDEELTSVQQLQIGDDAYVALAKRVVKAVYPPLSRFINILRVNYGQYWLRDLEKWDSRRESLGNYCRSVLGMWWSIDDGQSWTKFEPTPKIVMFTAQVPSEKQLLEYLTEDDWRRLPEIIKTSYQPTLAGLMLARASRLLNQGHLRQAYFEAVTALELAIGEFLGRRLASSNSLKVTIQPFWGLPLHAQLLAAVASLGGVSDVDMEGAVRAIGLRNKMAHEGLDPGDEPRPTLFQLFRVIAVLIEGPAAKHPKADGSNRLYPAD